MHCVYSVNYRSLISVERLFYAFSLSFKIIYLHVLSISIIQELGNSVPLFIIFIL